MRKLKAALYGFRLGMITCYALLWIFRDGDYVEPSNNDIGVMIGVVVCALLSLIWELSKED